MQKRIIIWHGWFCKVGGCETFVFNWCQQLREYYDIKVLTIGGDPKQLARLRKYVDVEILDKEKTYEAEIVIRNSVWSTKLPENIISTENRIIEMKHANYKYLMESGRIKDQYIEDDRVTEHLACGEFVSKMYEEVTGKKIPFIKNILAPKRRTEKIYRFLSTSRVYDPDKGWDDILLFCEKLRRAKMKFEFTIFSELPPNAVNMDGTLNVPYQEIHVYKPQLDVFDYVADADYVVLFTKSEGLPYSPQEALQYGTPCIVSDVGGCTELIQDEVNGYVVKDLASFDIEKIKKIPKLKAYKGTTADEWCDFLGGAEYVKKPVGEDREPRVKLRAKAFYDDTEEEVHLTPGDIYEVRESRAEIIVKADYAEYYKG